MSQQQNILAPSTEATSSKKMLIAMVGIGVICALLIVLAYDGTKERIELLKAEALEKAVFKVLPGVSSSQMFELGPDGKFNPVAKPEGKNPIVFAGYDDAGKFVGVAIESGGQGYADILRILYGYNPHTQTIVGFYVLESKETPGLGDKIDKVEHFLANFKELSAALSDDLSKIRNPIVPVKQGAKTNPWEVECITGATISSRAIGNIIGKSSAEVLPLIFAQKENFEKNPDQK
jgi:electron transport complex protein RnfG